LKQLLIFAILVILLLIAFIVGPWLLIYLGLSSEDPPPKPAYTYGEFPFYLEYAIHGQIKIIEDTVIVKYNGIGLSEGTGKYIKWKQTLASGNDEVVLFEDGESVRIIFTVRERNYHLEDEIHNEETKVPNLIKEVRKKRGGTTSSLYNETKIKLIKFEYGEPLKK
jgi:hypothetical protein